MIRASKPTGKKAQPARPALSQYHPKVLAGLVHPLKVYHFAALGSTNSHAMAMRRQGRLFAPALVVTSRQTAGRGRSGHSWWSRSGSVTATWVFPVEEDYAPHQLPLIVGLALRAACVEMSGSDDIQLKWPNDLVRDGMKLAGILCERCEGVDLVGIGLNLNAGDGAVPEPLRGRVVSLSELAGREFDINVAVATITRHLKRIMLGRTSHPFATFVQDYRKCDALRGREISVKTEGGKTTVRGRCEGIDRDGELLVRDAGGLHRLMSGSVTIVKIKEVSVAGTH